MQARGRTVVSPMREQHLLIGLGSMLLSGPRLLPYCLSTYRGIGYLRAEECACFRGGRRAWLPTALSAV
jgi:hypothetical protein